MKNKLDFRVSFGIIKENFKLYWYLPFLMFTFLFLGGPFSFIMAEEKESVRLSTLNFLSTFSFGQAMLYGFFSVITSTIVMGYLHKKSRSLMMHSEPFTRRKIYNSNVLTGLIMLIIPVLLIALIYMLLLNNQCIFALKNVTYFIISSVTILTFYYGTFILAGVLTGSTVIQLILCCAINVVIPLTTFVIEAWKEGFFKGYYGPSKFVTNIFSYCSPYVAVFNEEGRLDSGLLVMYFGIGLLLILIGNILIGFSKLEKTNDILFFKGLERAIVSLICLYSMSLFAFVFALLIDENHPYLMLAVGMFVGIILAFFITEIIINKSIKIFNKENGKFLITILISAIIFYLLIVCDILGISNKIPNKDKIESITINSLTFNYPLGIIDDSKDLIFTDDEIITNVINLNKEINKRDRKDDTTFNSNFDITSETIGFEYNLKNGKKVRKSYNIVIKNNDKIIPYIEEIVSSEEYKNSFLINDSYVNSIDKMVISPAKILEYQNIFNDAFIEYNDVILTELNKEQIKEFINSYNMDMENLSYKDFLNYIKVHPGDDTCVALIEYTIDEVTYYYYVQEYFNNMTEFIFNNMEVYN